MKTPLYSFLFFICFILHSYAQNNIPIERQYELIQSTEKFIVNKQIDSAAHYVNKINIDKDYVAILKKIINKDDLTYEVQERFVKNVSNNKNINHTELTTYINEYIENPIGNTINNSYVNLKVYQINRLRDDGALDKASVENIKLEKYVRKFNPEQPDVILAKAYTTFHPLVMSYIQGDYKKVKTIISKNLEIAKRYDAKYLKIASLNYLSDVLVVEGKLEEYIAKNEESLAIDKSLEERSIFYRNTLLHLLDAYIYKGGEDERVQELLDEMYSNPKIRIDSYTMYAKYLGSLLQIQKIKRKYLTSSM